VIFGIIVSYNKHMSDHKEKLEVLKEAWKEFKQVAENVNEEQLAAFEDAISKMDSAETEIKRKNVLDLYA